MVLIEVALQLTYQSDERQSFSDKPHAIQDDMGGHGVAMKVLQVKRDSNSRTGMPNQPLHEVCRKTTEMP